MFLYICRFCFYLRYGLQRFRYLDDAPVLIRVCVNAAVRVMKDIFEGDLRVVTFSDYERVPTNHPRARAARRAEDRRLRRRGFKRVEKEKPSATETVQVGSYSAAAYHDMVVVAQRHCNELVGSGQLTLPTDTDTLPVAVWKDAKSDGFAGLNELGKVSPLALNFFTSTHPAAFASYALLGVLLGNDTIPVNTSFWTTKVDGLSIADRVSALDGATIVVGERRLVLQLWVVGDYAELRTQTRVHASAIPFASLSSQVDYGLAARWFGDQPCYGCDLSAFSIYESKGWSGNQNAGWNPYIRVPPHRFIYGRMHGLGHLSGGFFADLTRTFSNVCPGDPLVTRLNTLFHAARTPRSSRSYDPLWTRTANKETSKHNAVPAAYANVYDHSDYDQLMSDVRAFATRHGAVLQQHYHVSADDIVVAMRSLRDVYRLAHTPPSNQLHANHLAYAFDQSAAWVDYVWLNLVRLNAKARTHTTLPPEFSPTYTPMVTGRGISAHYMINHYGDQIRNLGVYAANLHEKGGENLNNLTARIWGHYNMGSVADKSTLAAPLLKRATMCLFARASRPFEPTSSRELSKPYRGGPVNDL